MNEKQWKIFSDFKTEFKAKVEQWQKMVPELKQFQQQIASDNGLSYSVELPVVYNTNLDKISRDDRIALIVIGDNPGKNEQLLQNSCYLVGQAGKLADGFFKRNPCLNIDFRKNVIILNKTPVHSGKTKQLELLIKMGGEKVQSLIEETQRWMAEKTARLHIELFNAAETEEEKTQVWLVGYSELKNKGLFLLYKEELQKAYEKFPSVWQNVFVYQHFSMNRFSIDLKDFLAEQKNPSDLHQALEKLGSLHKEEIFGIN